MNEYEKQALQRQGLMRQMLALDPTTGMATLTDRQVDPMQAASAYMSQATRMTDQVLDENEKLQRQQQSQLQQSEQGRARAQAAIAQADAAYSAAVERCRVNYYNQSAVMQACLLQAEQQRQAAIDRAQGGQ